MFSTTDIERRLQASEKYEKCYFTLDESDMEATSRVLVDALKTFDEICRSNHLTYMLVAGALIGAKRNGKCLPWDDDIDLIMPREDYHELGKIIERDYKDSKWTIEYPGETGVLSLAAHFYDRTVIERELLKSSPNAEFIEDERLFLDILPLDAVPDNPAVYVAKGVLINFLQLSYTSRRCFKSYSGILGAMAKDSLKLRFNISLRKLLTLPTLPVSKARLLRTMEKILRNKKSERSSVVFGAKRYFGETLSNDVWYPVMNIDFEGMKIMAPNDPEAYLSNRYGDYSIIPSKEEQKQRRRRLKSNWKELL